MSHLNKYGIAPLLFLSLLILSTILSACTKKGSLLDRVFSVTGTSHTENLRQWIREDQDRDELLVFVHGFNSSKNSAWGGLLQLLSDDQDFNRFNIHAFGYPTAVCGRVGPVEDAGELLASFVNATTLRYKSITLIGHSMGGLVIQSALLKLVHDDPSLFKESSIKVLSFGTPYGGVEGAGLVSLICSNEQADQMVVLDNTRFKLERGWRQSFSRDSGQGTRNKPHVPLYAFYGLDDSFVPRQSACAGMDHCESVDGDHVSMVKPTTRGHLTYMKIKDLATRETRTQTGRGEEESIRRHFGSFSDPEKLQLDRQDKLCELSSNLVKLTGQKEALVRLYKELLQSPNDPSVAQEDALNQYYLDIQETLNHSRLLLNDLDPRLTTRDPDLGIAATEGIMHKNFWFITNGHFNQQAIRPRVDIQYIEQELPLLRSIVKKLNKYIICT